MSKYVRFQLVDMNGYPIVSVVLPADSWIDTWPDGAMSSTMLGSFRRENDPRAWRAELTAMGEL